MSFPSCTVDLGSLPSGGGSELLGGSEENSIQEVTLHLCPPPRREALGVTIVPLKRPSKVNLDLI